jgi:hypothetical protein
MAFAGLLLTIVKLLGPVAPNDGLAGPFVEGLAEELGGMPAPVDPAAGSAFFADRGDAGGFLETGGVGKAGAVGTEGDQKSGCQSGAGTGEFAEQLGFRYASA